jgi:DNA topoisomerase-2
LGLTRSTDLKAIRDNNALAKRRLLEKEEDIDVIADLKDVPLSSQYDYLLSMPLSSLTAEKIADLQKEASKKEQDFEQLQNTSPEDLWRADLDKLAALL